MNQKIKVFSAVLVFWAALFVAWEWWHSFPKVRTNPSLKLSSTVAGVDSILNQAMSTYLLPGISVAVVKSDQVIYLNAFGFENLQTKAPLTVDSQILVASVSKLFTALALSKVMSERGILPADSLAIFSLKDLYASPLSNLQFKSLLSHTSGLRDMNFKEKIFSSSKTQSLKEWGTDFLQAPKANDPEAIEYSYSDSNYDFLGYLLGESEQLDFAELLDRNVFAPCGMINSAFVNHWPIEETGITGYQKTFLWKRIEPKRIKFSVLPSPSSGLVTTTKDMSIAMTQLLRGNMGVYQKELEWLRIDGSNEQLGFQKTQINGTEWLGHFGGQAGYSSLMFYSKEADTGIFLFSNSRDKEDFRIEVARQVILYISP